VPGTRARPPGGAMELRRDRWSPPDRKERRRQALLTSVTAVHGHLQSGAGAFDALVLLRALGLGLRLGLLGHDQGLPMRKHQLGGPRRPRVPGSPESGARTGARPTR